MMKHNWVIDFADLVRGHAEDNGDEMDSDLAYQLGCAYYDYDENGPVETVEEAFSRYKLFDTAIKKSFKDAK